MRSRLQLPDQFTEEQTAWWMNCGMREGWEQTVNRLVKKLAGP